MKEEREYRLKKCSEEDAREFFVILMSRIAWMDEKGIEQWNKCPYLEIFPLSYFLSMAREGRLYALENEDGSIASAAVVLSEDERWGGREGTALYIHNLASRIEKKGSGKELISRIEKMAVDEGKEYLRLDSDESNEELAAYYRSLGFLPSGSCRSGDYRGTLWQKKLRVNHA